MSQSTETLTDHEFPERAAAKARFEGVMARLAAAIGAKTKADIAEALSMKTNAYANRQRVGSIPFEEVVNLCRDRGLSLDALLLTEREFPSSHAAPGAGRSAEQPRTFYGVAEGCDIDLLRNAIAAVEQFCAERGLRPSIEQKATVIATVYSMVRDGLGAHMRSVSVVMEQLLTD